MTDWHPIETAPRDGTVVLLYCPESWDTNGIRVGWWREDDWYDDEAASHSVTEMFGKPTLWQPAPTPPED